MKEWLKTENCRRLNKGQKNVSETALGHGKYIKKKVLIINILLGIFFDMAFKIYGKIIEKETGKGIPNLTVKAIDKDLFFELAKKMLDESKIKLRKIND